MIAEVQADLSKGGGRPEIAGPGLPIVIERRNPMTRRTRLAVLYGRCFSRIRVGEKKTSPALIQVDCRESSPLSAVRRITRSCARIGRGDLIELLTGDLAAVVAALTWCKAQGGRVERMESASGAYVLDITPDGGETEPCTYFHAPAYDHISRSQPDRGMWQA